MYTVKKANISRRLFIYEMLAYTVDFQDKILYSLHVDNSAIYMAYSRRPSLILKLLMPDSLIVVVKGTIPFLDTGCRSFKIYCIL